MSPLELRHLRMTNAIRGYRGQEENNPLPLGPEWDKVHGAYLAGRHRLAVRQSIDPETIITGKGGDRVCLVTCALAAAYFMGHVIWAGVRP